MKDIPLFTTEYGVASLVLQQIPYTDCGYVRIQTAWDSKKLLEECIGFCRAVGAKKVFAAGEELESYPLHTGVVRMSCLKDQIPETDACLLPVTERTLEDWRQIYNQAMTQVPNAAWMTEQEARSMLSAGDGYFVHKDGKLLGIGKASGGKIDAVVAVVHGSGETVMQALCSILRDDVVTLEVATANEKAMKLYWRMGFSITAELSRWYRVF